GRLGRFRLLLPVGGVLLLATVGLSLVLSLWWGPPREPPDAPEPPEAREVAAILKDARLILTFEKETFYEKEGKTYVRDLSGQVNDALCEEVRFATEGRAGGGLINEG